MRKYGNLKSLINSSDKYPAIFAFQLCIHNFAVIYP